MKKLILMTSVLAFALFGLTACCSKPCDTCPQAKNCQVATQTCPAAKDCPKAKTCPVAQKQCPAKKECPVAPACPAKK